MKYTDRTYSFVTVPKAHKGNPESPEAKAQQVTRTDSAMSFSDIERRWSRKGFYVVPGTGIYHPKGV